jgi:hypothetical protein
MLGILPVSLSADPSTVLNTRTLETFSSIQDAVDDPDTLAGDTLEVGPGTYDVTAQITITKSVNIVGDTANKPILRATTLVTYMMKADSATPNIANLIFDGNGQAYVGLGLPGVHVDGMVEGCVFKDIFYAQYLGFGIVIYGEGYTIEGNIFENIERVGIWIGPPQSGTPTGIGCTIKNNIYTGKGDGDHLDYAVEVGMGGVAHIEGNTISGCTGLASGIWGSAGILVTTYYGAGTKATITQNIITGNSVGIHVGYDEFDTAEVVAHGNCITGNIDYGIYSTAPLVNAEYNWWGDASGPGGVGTGTGDAVSLYVDYDPWVTGGFVTGGGWLNSPLGAYKPDITLTGKATFAFVAKYSKHTCMEAEGNTQFMFKTADLNFHSSSYDWLGVNQAGSNAQFKGTGTINGQGEYKFMIWATDNEPDTFRIKIWEETAGIETVIYDNGVDQPIESGNIVVHTKGKK